MSKVADLVRDALLHLGVVDAAEPIGALDMQDAIRALNQMMARLEANGMNLGWAPVDSPEQALPLPPEAEEAIGYNLAVKLRTRYGLALAADVFQMANDGLAALRRDVRVAHPLEYARNGTYYDIYTDSYR